MLYWANRRQKSLAYTRWGDRLTEFLESRPAAAAFLKFTFEFANTFTMRESSGIIDDYVRGEGTPWYTLRRSCGIEMIPATDDITKPRIRDEIELGESGSIN